MKKHSIYIFKDKNTKSSPITAIIIDKTNLMSFGTAIEIAENNGIQSPIIEGHKAKVISISHKGLEDSKKRQVKNYTEHY